MPEFIWFHSVSPCFILSHFGFTLVSLCLTLVSRWFHSVSLCITLSFEGNEKVGRAKKGRGKGHIAISAPDVTRHTSHAHATTHARHTTISRLVAPPPTSHIRQTPSRSCFCFFNNSTSFSCSPSICSLRHHGARNTTSKWLTLAFICTNVSTAVSPSAEEGSSTLRDSRSLQECLKLGTR